MLDYINDFKGILNFLSNIQMVLSDLNCGKYKIYLGIKDFKFFRKEFHPFVNWREFSHIKMQKYKFFHTQYTPYYKISEADSKLRIRDFKLAQVL